MKPVTEILAAELAYPGGNLRAQLPLAQRHVARVAAWLASSSAAATPTARSAPVYTGARLAGSVHLVDAAQLRAARSDVILRDGAGLVLAPEGRVLIDAGYPLFTQAGLRRYAPRPAIAPLNPLVALRWTLTDLLLRLNALNTPIALTVADYAGNVVLLPYARGFAIGSAAIYARPYHYGQPNVNLGFDSVALKVLAALLSQGSGLSYVANMSGMPAFAPFLNPIRTLVGANGITTSAWQSLYQTSRVEDAIFALIARSRRHFGEDPDPSHLGLNVAHSAYGYGIMKAVSRGDGQTLRRTLSDFALPREPALPTVAVA